MGDVSNCLKRHIKKFHCVVDAHLTFELDDDRSLLEDIFKQMISIIKIETQGYAITDVRDLINKKLLEKASVEVLIFLYYSTKVDAGPLQNWKWNSL